MTSSSDVYRVFARHPSLQCLLPLSPSSYLLRSASTYYSCHHFNGFPSSSSLVDLYQYFLGVSKLSSISIPSLLDIITMPDNSHLLITQFISGRRPEPSELPSLFPSMVDFALAAQSSGSIHDHLFSSVPNSFDLLRNQILSSPLFPLLPDCLGKHLMIDPPPGPTSPCHGDFLPQNLVIAQNARPFLVDWESTGFSPSFFDLGWLKAYCILSGFSLPLSLSRYHQSLSYFTRFAFVRFAFRSLQRPPSHEILLKRLDTYVSLFHDVPF